MKPTLFDKTTRRQTTRTTGFCAGNGCNPAVVRMIPRWHLMLWLPLFTLCFISQAQYSIDWYTVDGGGGGGSGGAYSLTGTIGQPDAGLMQDAVPYAVQGGFWSVLGTRPTLRFWIAAGNVVVAWPDTASDCHLQETDNLGDRYNHGVATWSNVSQVPSVVGGELQVTMPLPASRQYYFRLVKP